MDMAQALEELVAKKQIEELIYSYCIVGDRSDIEGLRTLYHSDACDDHGTRAQGSANNFLSMLDQAVKDGTFSQISHNVTNCVIKLDGDYAEGISYFIAFHVLKDENGEAYDYFFAGRYLDKLQRRDGVWKFLHRRVVSDMVYRHAPSQMELDDPMNLGVFRGSDGPDDPMYAFFKLFRRGTR